jgi:putative addiction module component (TIGR02574 family)
MPTMAEILENALQLGIHDRALFAERLLASLEELTEEEAERLWADEAQRRLDEYRAGRARVISRGELHAKAEKILRNGAQV